MTIHELPTPALLLDLDILERNIARMQERAKSFSVALRPHIKTHKCIEIGRKQLQAGAAGITVSTFYEAEQFAAAGFTDISWAFPIPPVYAIRASELSEKITFRTLIDSFEAKGHLEKVARVNDRKLHVWLKVDCGYHRAGVDPRSELAERLCSSLAESQSLLFDGILTHAGHAYLAKSKEEIQTIAEQERSVMVEFADRMKTKGILIPAISIGSTPTMWRVERLDGIAEIRPGNYVFNDFHQAAIGSCDVSDCALTVLASVISHQPGASHFVIDAGALALSKDPGPIHLKNTMDMGILFEDYDRKRLYSHIHLAALSQEHGKVVADGPETIDGRFVVGERVRILEHHSCLTAAQFDEYYVVQGERVIDRWKILRGRA
jgi:D-serine deaminase-like pyridoxal phosphate-dependent protein